MKLFTEKQIGVSAVLAGPIPPGILMYKNYLTLGKEKEAYITLGSTFFFTILLFFTIFQVPSEIMDKIPNAVFTSAYGLIIYLVYKKFMAKLVNEALENSAAKKSNWSVTGLTLFGLLINVIIVFAFAIDQPLYDGKMVNINGNDLYYDENVPANHVNELGKKLMTKEFFGADFNNTARIQSNQEGYLVTLLVDREFWNDDWITIELTEFKNELSTSFKVTTKLQLESLKVSGPSEFKEVGI